MTGWNTKNDIAMSVEADMAQLEIDKQKMSMTERNGVGIL